MKVQKIEWWIRITLSCSSVDLNLIHSDVIAKCSNRFCGRRRCFYSTVQIDTVWTNPKSTIWAFGKCLMGCHIEPVLSRIVSFFRFSSDRVSCFSSICDSFLSPVLSIQLRHFYFFYYFCFYVNTYFQQSSVCATVFHALES